MEGGTLNAVQALPHACSPFWLWACSTASRLLRLRADVVQLLAEMLALGLQSRDVGVNVMALLLNLRQDLLQQLELQTDAAHLPTSTQLARFTLAPQLTGKGSDGDNDDDDDDDDDDEEEEEEEEEEEDTPGRVLKSASSLVSRRYIFYR